jgi:hypothetical protein
MFNIHMNISYIIAIQYPISCELFVDVAFQSECRVNSYILLQFHIITQFTFLKKNSQYFQMKFQFEIC